jgi:steroid 5-alpha reductase family enzyme
MKTQQVYFSSIILSLILLIAVSVNYGIFFNVGACLLGIMVSMHLFFLIGVLTKNHTFVDTAWGLSFVIVAHVSFWIQEDHTPVRWIVLAMVTVWGLRLFWHIAKRTLGKEEDLRYQDMRKKMGTKKSAILASYIQIYLIQGFLALFISTPIIMINSMPPNDLHRWYPVGIIVWIFGLTMEAAADWQLKNFLSQKQNHGQIMTRGLWKVSRHPNYFGESILWWGVYLVALTVVGGWTSFFGPLLLTFLLLKVSGVPPAEKLMRNLPGFEEYKRRTSMFIPWFRKD